MSYMFCDCHRLVTLDISDWDTSTVTDMYSMFEDCSALASTNTSRWPISEECKTTRMFDRL
jgi:surface protein